MNDQTLAAKPVEELLDLLIRSLGLDVEYRLTTSTGEVPEITVQLSGPDALLLTENNGELLHAIEHVAAKILHLESEEHDRILFDADRFKEDRNRDLQSAAEAAIAHVRTTGTPFAFPPMTSRERRMLHLALQPSGLPTSSSGENPRRFVVLYPEAPEIVELDTPPVAARTHTIRNAFRPR